MLVHEIFLSGIDPTSIQFRQDLDTEKLGVRANLLGLASILLAA
jgi:hypothetical protein